MNQKKEKEEYLERLWHMKEQNKNNLNDLRSLLGDEFDPNIIEQLAFEDLLEFNSTNDTIRLTENGEKQASRIIRAHRLAERLFYDVLGCEREAGACEFEHTVTPELVDAICILLGHPKKCPHGLHIPQGDCCRNSVKTTESSVVPITEIKVAQSARIAYINSPDDQQLHKMDGLQIRPGATVKLHQRYPAYVIECEGISVAMDEKIVSNIFVWKESCRHEE